jgi:hypothetical protein
MPQYISSTDPQSAANAPAQTYSNFNGINCPVIKSTGTFDLTGTPTITGDLALTGAFVQTGDFNLIDAVEAVAGATDPLATSADLDNVSYQAVTSTSGALKKYLLDAPAAGARKTVLCNAAGLGDVYVYASASSAYTAHFGANTSGNIMSFTTCNTIIVNLLGASTAKWLVESVSTLNNGTTGTLVITSSNS